jgi:hypothetical protein
MDQVTVEQAAHILGIKEESVRKRVRRGKLRADKDSEGRLLVYVDRTGTVRDEYEDRSGTADNDLVVELRDRIAYLERQVEEERESRRRADTLLAQLTQANAALAARVPELETAESREEGAEGAAEGGVRVGYPAGDTGHSEGSERPRDTAEFPAGGSLTRPWWRRIIGG